MKKIVASFIVVLMLSVVGWLVSASISTLEHKKESNLTISSLSGTLNKLNVPFEQLADKTVIVYFNSECDHCQWEVQEISKHQALFSETQLMFVSHEPRESAIGFLAQYDMEDYYLEALPENVLTTFSGVVPQLFVYHGEQLKERFHGEVKMKLIEQAL